MQIQRPKLSNSEYEAKNKNKVACDLIQTAAKAFVASVVNFAAVKDYYRIPVRTPNVEHTHTNRSSCDGIKYSYQVTIRLQLSNDAAQYFAH